MDRWPRNLNTGYPQHLAINLKNGQGDTKNQEINTKNVNKKNKEKVDKYPIRYYIIHVIRITLSWKI